VVVARRGGVTFGRTTLVLFVICQACDGLLTYFAVSAFGHAIEGNPILATWMTVAGAVPTLLVAKTGACACGVILYAHGTHRALASLTAVYLLCAVAPWVYLLTGR
jgi:arginine exporter protein ArgO